MVDTIQEALKYFYFVAFFFGFGILRYPSNYSRVRLSILYMLSVWSVYAYLLYYVFTSFLNIIKPNVMMYFYLTINLLNTVISIIISIRQHKKFNILINKLNQVDNTLEELGTSKKYHRMQNSVKWIIIMWFIIINIIWTTNSICMIDTYNDKKNLKLLFSIIIEYSYFINILTDVIIMFILRYIGNRYDKINILIKQLSETKQCRLKCMCKISFPVTHHYSINNSLHILWITMHLHSQLCRITLDINSLFQIQMTLQTMSYFITFTMMFYFQYKMIICLIYNGGAIQWKCLLASYITCGINLIRFILFNYICESISAKAQKTNGIIHRLTNIICFVKAREEICQFVLQISLRPLKLSGMGLFYFGHKFLYKFFIWILSFIIIIIQFNTYPIYRRVSNRDNIICHEFLE